MNTNGLVNLLLKTKKRRAIKIFRNNQAYFELIQSEYNYLSKRVDDVIAN